MGILKLRDVATGLAILTVLFAAFFWLNNNHANAAYVQQIDQRLDVKILYDRRDNIQNRMWSLQDRYPNNYRVNPEYRELQLEMEQIDNSIKGKK